MTDVRGTVADQFAPVADQLRRNASELGEVGAAVSAYLGGEKVVDLWIGDAAADGSRAWAEDTLAMIFSSTKGLVAFSAQILADRGLLDVDAPVTDYWPEYGANGKGSTLVRHFLNHTAGVLTFPNYWELIDRDGRGLERDDVIIERLAASAPAWEPGTMAGDHALTSGYLVGELVRRIDGRSVGRFFAEELAGPLGLDLWIGIPDPALNDRIADAIAPRPPSGDDPAVAAAIAAQEQILVQARAALLAGDWSSPEALFCAAVFLHPDRLDPVGFNTYLAQLMNTPSLRACEMPGGNGVGDARSLARLYAPLSLGGSFDGRTYVSPAAIDQFRVPQSTTEGAPTTTALGYGIFAQEDGVPGPSEQAFGHGGAGGQMAFADPVHGLSFGYVKNQMLTDQTSTVEIIRSVYRCL